MELEEMKSLWQEMSTEIEKQKKLTDTLIIKMTQAGYRNKISKIAVPETIGAFVCLVELVYILIHFQQLNTWYLLVCGIVAALILCLLPVLSIRAVLRIGRVDIVRSNYRQMLQAWSKSKLQFVRVQKISFYLGALLLVTGLPVVGKLMAGKDLFTTTPLWIWYAVGFIFFYFLSVWVFKRYMKTVADAENILKELEG